MSASPGPGRCRATSVTSYSPGARNTFARIVSIAIIAILLSDGPASAGVCSLESVPMTPQRAGRHVAQPAMSEP
jgi:hypothetical protein